MRFAIPIIVLLVGACAEEQHPDDPLRFNERGLRQSPEKGEGLGNDQCPNGCPEPDADRDGIPDDRDACPKAADTDPVEAAFDGCPGSGTDQDRDGVPDAKDLCPDAAGAAGDGCPEPPAA